MMPGRLEEGLEVLIDHAVEYGVLNVTRLIVPSAAAHRRDMGSAARDAARLLA